MPRECMTNAIAQIWKYSKSYTKGQQFQLFNKLTVRTGRELICLVVILQNNVKWLLFSTTENIESENQRGQLLNFHHLSFQCLT